MVTPQFDYLVFIGRFQPFHRGHYHVINEALQHSKKLILLLGSANSARSLRNPFSYTERHELILQSLPASMQEKIIIRPINDHTYDDGAWVEAIQHTVNEVVDGEEKPAIALIGHDKDETTYYLKLFPNWGYHEVENLDGMSATTVRHDYFSDNKATEFTHNLLFSETSSWLSDFAISAPYRYLKAEYQALLSFKQQWQATPYPVIFTTVDTLIRHHDMVLLIRRKDHPGKGLLALPGGFLDKDESLLNAALRELKEETQISVGLSKLPQHLIKQQVFSAPKRSSRGRVITHCFYFDISTLNKPDVQAADDAAEVMWVDLSSIKANQFFEDHYFIIQRMLLTKNGRNQP